MTTEAETARPGSLQPPGSQWWEGGPWSPQREQDPVDTLTLGFWPPEPLRINFCYFQPSSMWASVRTATGC